MLPIPLSRGADPRELRFQKETAFTVENQRGVRKSTLSEKTFFVSG